MTINCSTHPISFISDILGRYPEVLEVELSAYQYVPKSVSDPRKIMRISAESLRTEFCELLTNLDPTQELACHSRVYIKKGSRNKLYHIPMIDFVGDVGCAYDDIVKVMKEFHCDRASLYLSGRSYHFYGFTLLSSEEWVRFMGRILLLNIPGIREVVDCRWVGHRLLAGYGSLRWSMNTTAYKQLPTLQSWITPTKRNANQYCRPRPEASV
jgi:hypothetical protein